MEPYLFRRDGVEIGEAALKANQAHLESLREARKMQQGSLETERSALEADQERIAQTQANGEAVSRGLAAEKEVDDAESARPEPSGN